MKRFALLAVLGVALAFAPTGSAQNLLANPGFESGNLNGWMAFGNVFLEALNPPQFVPNSGGFMVSIFGTFNPGFDSVMFQQFPAAPGEAYEMDGFGRHYSGDALQQGNRAFMKIVFRDALGNELAGVDRDLVNATSPTDVWIDAVPIQLVAPPGTVMVEAFVIFSQIPALAPGAAHIDDLVFRKLPSSLEMSQDMIPINFDLTINIREGAPGFYAELFTLDPLNAILPLQGPFGGMWMSTIDFNNQAPLALMGVSPFGGNLNANGERVVTVGGAPLVNLTGLVLYSVVAQVDASGAIVFSNVANYTFQ